MKNKTIKPSKNRKRIYSAKLHETRKLLVSPLEKTLAEKINKKKLTIRKGDSVKILRGQHKGKTGTVSKVDYTKTKVYLKEINVTNARGQERPIPFVASNLIITNAVLDDKKRIGKVYASEKKKAPKKEVSKEPKKQKSKEEAKESK